MLIVNSNIYKLIYRNTQKINQAKEQGKKTTQ